MTKWTALCNLEIKTQKSRVQIVLGFYWSRWEDLNLRLLRPERSALPNWATPRYKPWILKAILAAVPGFEPRQTESESAVLPLHNTAICFAVFLSFRLFPSDNVVYYSRYPGKVNPFFKKTLKIWNLFFEWELKRAKKRGIMRLFAFSAVYGLCQKTRAECLRHTLCGIFRQAFFRKNSKNRGAAAGHQRI